MERMKAHGSHGRGRSRGMPGRRLRGVRVRSDPAEPSHGGPGLRPGQRASAGRRLRRARVRRAGFGRGRRRMRRGDIRRAVLWALRPARPRLRVDAPARGAQRRRVASEPRLGLPDPADAGGRGTGPLRTARRHRTYELTDADARKRRRTLTTGGPLGRRERGRRTGSSPSARDRTGPAGGEAASRAGHPDQIERSIEVIQRARKELYQILAED